MFFFFFFFFFSSRRRHTRCRYVTEFRRVLFRSTTTRTPRDDRQEEERPQQRIERLPCAATTQTESGVRRRSMAEARSVRGALRPAHPGRDDDAQTAHGD